MENILAKLADHGLTGLVLYMLFRYVAPRFDDIVKGFANLTSSIDNMSESVRMSLEHNTGQNEKIIDMLEKNKEMTSQNSHILELIKDRMDARNML